MRDDGSFAEPNDLRIPGKETYVNAVSEDFCARQEITQLLNKHFEVFKGIGRIRDNRDDKDLFVKFNIKPDAAPIAQKPRPVAYYL